MKKSIFLAIAVAASTTLFAQKDSLNAVINVENDYAPVVVKATKKSYMPQTEENTNRAPLALDFSQEPTPFKGFTSKRAVEDLLPKQAKSLPGYARLGYGIGNNIDGKLAYRYDISKRDEIKAMASIEGFNREVKSPSADWNSRVYNSWVSSDYSHRFDRLILGVHGYFENNLFNYNALKPTDKQDNKKFDININGASQLAGPFAYKFSAGFARNHYKYNYGEESGFSQNNIYVNGLLSHEIDNKYLSNINLGIDIDNYSYNGSIDWDNFLMADFNAYSDIVIKNTKFHIGAIVSLMSDNGSTFAIAPDLGFESLITKRISLYATVKGGRTAGTFEALESTTPYWANYYDIVSVGKKAAYTIADATIGARYARNMFSVDMYAGYAYTKDDFLNYDAYITPNEKHIISAVGQENTARAYVGANAMFNYKERFKLLADTRYTHWKCDEEYMLATKPQFEFGVKGEARLMEDFYVALGYQFASYKNDDPSLNKHELNMRTSYKFWERYSAFIEGNNLLNRKYVKYAGYYEQGINLLFGVSAAF